MYTHLTITIEWQKIKMTVTNESPRKKITVTIPK